MKHNIEKIKVLDIDIDLNFVVLSPSGKWSLSRVSGESMRSDEWAIYGSSGAPAICMDFGHLTLKRGTNPSGDEHEEAKVKSTDSMFFTDLFMTRTSTMLERNPTHSLTWNWKTFKWSMLMKVRSEWNRLEWHRRTFRWELAKGLWSEEHSSSSDQTDGTRTRRGQNVSTVMIRFYQSKVLPTIDFSHLSLVFTDGK